MNEGNLKKAGVAVLLLGLVGGGIAYLLQRKEEAAPPMTGGESSATCNADLDAYQILKGSWLLHDRGLKVYMSHREGSKFSLPKTCTDLVGPFFAATTQQVSGLNGKSSVGGSPLPWGCGDDNVEGAAFAASSLAGEAAPFVFQGDAEDLKIEWKAAREESGAALCSKPRAGHQMDKHLAYRVDGFSFPFVLETQSKLPSEGSTEECDRDHYSYQLSVGAKDGCRTLLSATMDCDHKPSTEDPFVDGVLGVLVITRGQVVERWLTLVTPGYEGDGISVVPLDETGAPDKSKLEYLVYSGC